MIYRNRKKLTILGLILTAVFLFYIFEVYVPNLGSATKLEQYVIQSGKGTKGVADDLKKQGIIKSSFFFRFYALVSYKYSKLQAGKYDLSSDMSISEIVNKMALGDISTYKITLLEGWTIKDMSDYLEKNNFYSSKDFIDSTKKDWIQEFIFLKDKPKKLDLEGYIFPDTYQVHPDDNIDVLTEKALSNFDKKLTPELKQEITKQKKTIFQIVTMASIIEKEASNTEDRKMISGILWKRLKVGFPLQVDASVNFITGKSDSKVAIKDTKIDSPYNTYKYAGLPLGPISNPGIDSILAAIYPTDNPYWYYLAADGTGQTIFSETVEEHQAAIDKYFR